MTARRRSLLAAAAGGAALAASSSPSASSTPSLDAAIIRDCERFVALDWRVNAWGYSPSPLTPKDEAERAEHDRLMTALENCEPQTREGWASLARAALVNGFAIDDGWDGWAPSLAYGILLGLAPPGTEEEVKARHAVKVAAVGEDT